MEQLKQDIIFTADPQEMYGKYVAEELYRSWKEVNKANNEEFEKKETILKRGELLDSDAIAKVQFHLQTGDIKGVFCSAIQRRATIADPPAWQKPWKVQVENSIKPTKHTVLLYAKTVADALAITAEYMERTYEGIFTFKSVGNFDDAVFVAPEPRELKDGESMPPLNFYIISVSARWRDDDDMQNGTIVLQAENVDEAVAVIEKRIIKRREDYVNALKSQSEDKERIAKEVKKLNDGFVLTLNEAKIVNCTDIVPRELSNSYYPDDRKG